MVARAVALIPALLLLAFGPRQNQQLPTDRVIVEYWEKWTGEEEVGTRAVVDDFNKTVGRDKGIFVRYLSTSAVDRKTLVACAAGVPPDIAGFWESNIAQFAAENALLSLDQLAAEHHIDEPSYKPAFWKECHYGNTLYAMVSTGYDVAFYYNKRLFREAGLDPNHPPASIAELDAYAKRLDRIDPDGHVRCTGYMPMEPGWFINWTLIWFGGSRWD